MLARPALALLAAVRRLVARLLRYRLQGGASVGLGLLSSREGDVRLCVWVLVQGRGVSVRTAVNNHAGLKEVSKQTGCGEESAKIGVRVLGPVTKTYSGSPIIVSIFVWCILHRVIPKAPLQCSPFTLMPYLFETATRMYMHERCFLGTYF